MTGTLDELAARADELAGAWLRVIVAEPPRAGLAEEVRRILPDALDIGIDDRFRPARARRTGGGQVMARTPRELFRGYLQDVGAPDDRVAALFDRLYDEVTH